MTEPPTAVVHTFVEEPMLVLAERFLIIVYDTCLRRRNPNWANRPGVLQGFVFGFTVGQVVAAT